MTFTYIVLNSACHTVNAWGRLAFPIVTDYIPIARRNEGFYLSSSQYWMSEIGFNTFIFTLAYRATLMVTWQSQGIHFSLSLYLSFLHPTNAMKRQYEEAFSFRSKLVAVLVAWRGMFISSPVTLVSPTPQAEKWENHHVLELVPRLLQFQPSVRTHRTSFRY